MPSAQVIVPPSGSAKYGRPDPAVTQLLERAQQGGSEAAQRLAALVFDELKSIARNLMSGERRGHTLQPTALVNEAYLRLLGLESVTWKNRAHFFAAAANAMRRVLIDYARMRNRDKRGGGAGYASLDEMLVAAKARGEDVLALDEALTELAALNERVGRVVEMKYFAGMTASEIAETLGVSTRTVEGDWTFARAWLRTRMLELTTL